ncbi:sigma factor-like helix-turn-helix DNA-binding protein [Ligilactobacillus agilis]|uniref:sigma factor-like helix-turn-helix DNA-binding protein n=1 Tax=Ligilactobacillus agilis TaxID=1601 RepID=UPI001CDD6A23|nr:sigma factor-like helix-turn-helix DNA-binding protein [Ligilactobacillus agilis]
MDKIERLEEKLKVLTDRYELKAQTYSDEPKGGRPATLEDMVIQKEKLESRIAVYYSKSRAIRDRFEKAAEKMDNQTEAKILDYYFFEGMTLEQIADELGYTVRHVSRLYHHGLSVIDL